MKCTRIILFLNNIISTIFLVSSSIVFFFLKSTDLNSLTLECYENVNRVRLDRIKMNSNNDFSNSKHFIGFNIGTSADSLTYRSLILSIVNKNAKNTVQRCACSSVSVYVVRVYPINHSDTI